MLASAESFENLATPAGFELADRPHENFRRGAALREIVSDVGRFDCSATKEGAPPSTVVYRVVVANGWQGLASPLRRPFFAIWEKRFALADLVRLSRSL
jgi:hypothetical protein